jgi:hypothetical protein
MALAGLIRGVTVFLVLAVMLGTNLEDNVIARLGLTVNYAHVAGAAFIGTALIANRGVFVIVVIVVSGLNANMPTDFVLNLGFDRDYYAGLMMAIVCQPFLAKLLGML